MTKRVVDADLILREIEKFLYPATAYYKDSENPFGTDVTTLCLRIKSMIENHSHQVETYTSSYMIDNEFVSHLPKEERERFDEQLWRSIYQRMGDYLFENHVGKLCISPLDYRTRQITETLELKVIKPEKEGNF